MTSTTSSAEYAERLLKSRQAWWKKIIDPQIIYGAHIRRLDPGFTLDIGCGIGRNLIHIGGNGIGIDHNSHAVQIAASMGLRAYTPGQFKESEWNKPELFDTILLSHLLEHLTSEESTDLIRLYTPLLKSSGRIIVICPQKAGYASDPTHVTYLDQAGLRQTATALKMDILKEYSFPLPAFFGGIFKYNEHISIWGRKNARLRQAYGEVCATLRE